MKLNSQLLLCEAPNWCMYIVHVLVHVVLWSRVYGEEEEEYDKNEDEEKDADYI